MEFLRVSKNQWGQEVLEGVSWDLLSVFFGVAVVFIVGHALFMWWMTRDTGQDGPDGPDK